MRTRDRVDDALRRVVETAGGREAVTTMLDTGARQKAKNVLDATANVAHETLAVSVDLLQLVPFPGLAEAAKTLLYIWDGVQVVDLNRMQCLRLTERCANILISVRDEVVEAVEAEAADRGISAAYPSVPADLEYPLRRLVDAFAQIQAFLQQQAHRPFIKRYLKRDDILRQLQGCDGALQDAVDAFGFSVQFRIYRYVRMLDAERRGRVDSGVGLEPSLNGTRPPLGGASRPLQITGARGEETGNALGLSTTPRTDTMSRPETILRLEEERAGQPATTSAAAPRAGTTGHADATTARDILAPLELGLRALEARAAIAARNAAEAAEAMGPEREEWVAIKEPLDSRSSEDVPPGSPFARPAGAEPDLDPAAPDLSPAEIAARMRARRARENAEDTRRDVADLRGVMRKAMEIPNDAALLEVLQVDGAEIPEAVRALQRALEGALKKAEEGRALSRQGSLQGGGQARAEEGEGDLTLQGRRSGTATGPSRRQSLQAEKGGRGRNPSRRGTVDSMSAQLARAESLASNAASLDLLQPALSRRATSTSTVVPETSASATGYTGVVLQHPGVGGVGMSETPSAGSTTGIKSGFVGRRVWKTGAPTRMGGDVVVGESASAGRAALADDRSRTVSGESTDESFITASSAESGGDLQTNAAWPDPTNALDEDDAYHEGDDAYDETDFYPDAPYDARDMLDREFMESGIDAMRRMSRPGAVHGAVAAAAYGGWGGTTHGGAPRDAQAVSSPLSPTRRLEGSPVPGASAMQQPWNLPDWTITRYEIDREIKIGVGYFSDVYKGTWKGRAVAIKVLAPTTPRKLFVREAAIWRTLRHRNVLPLYGASSAVEGGMWFLVSPYLPNGTLVEYLKRVEQRIAAGLVGSPRLAGSGSPRLAGQGSPRLPGATLPHAKGATYHAGSPVMEAGTAHAGGFALSTEASTPAGADARSAHQRTMSLDRRTPGTARQDSLSVGLLRASLERSPTGGTALTAEGSSSSSSSSTTPTGSEMTGQAPPSPEADDDPADLLRYLLEIAKGMEYLHSKGILHGDLKAANVLVDDQHHAVISDFGQSEMRSEVYRISGLGGLRQGTLRWQAPELLSGTTERITTETDVYAYAITAVEVLGFGRLPWGQLDDAAVRWAILTNDARPQVPGITARGTISSHTTPTATAPPTPAHHTGHTSPASPLGFVIPPSAGPAVLVLLQMCWEQDPFRRPMFSRVVRDVKRLRKQAGWVEASDLPGPGADVLPSDAFTEQIRANEEAVKTLPSPDLAPIPLPGGSRTPKLETTPLGALDIPDLSKTPPGNAVGLPPGQAAALWGTPPAGTDALHARRAAAALGTSPGGLGLAGVTSQSDSTSYATAKECRDSSGSGSSQPGAVRDSPEAPYHSHMEESVSISSSSSTSDEGLLREAGLRGPPMHMPEPVLYTSSSRASSLFIRDEDTREGEIMGMSDSIMGPMVAGMAAGGQETAVGGGADYVGYDSPPPATKMLAEIKNERRYRLLLSHEYHPSLNLPLWTPTSVEVGAVGYLSKPAGRFVTLFNAFTPDQASDATVRGLPSVNGYGVYRVGMQQVEKRGLAQRGLDAIVGFLTYKGRGGGASSQNVARRYSYPLRSGHKAAYLCTEAATYRYLFSADAAKRWFIANVDAVVRAYGREHHIGKEDLFFVVGTLNAADHALFVSHAHPDGQAHFNVYAVPQPGQAWGTFTCDAAPEVAGPSYEDPPLQSVTASKVSGSGDPPKTVLLARLRFKPDEREPTTKL